MGIRVVRWPLDLLCSLQERCSRLQHTLGRGRSLLHDPLLVSEDVELFLHVLPHRLARGFGRLAERLCLLTQLFGMLPVLFRLLAKEFSNVPVFFLVVASLFSRSGLVRQIFTVLFGTTAALFGSYAVLFGSHTVLFGSSAQLLGRLA